MNEHKKRYKCPWCHKVFVGNIPRGGDGSVKQYPYHEQIWQGKSHFKCYGSLRICEPNHEVTR